jgi:hypothetical protein
MNDESICNCGVVGEKVVGPREISFGHWKTNVEDHFLRCPECGEKWYLPGQMQAMLLAAAKQIREEHGLFDPERIRNLSRRSAWTLITSEARNVPP